MTKRRKIVCAKVSRTSRDGMFLKVKAEHTEDCLQRKPSKTEMTDKEIADSLSVGNKTGSIYRRIRVHQLQPEIKLGSV